MPPPETVFVSTSPGLEPALLREAASLGEATRVPGGVELRGEEGLHRAACLHLRTANQVLLRIAELRGARDPQRAISQLDVRRFGAVQLEATGRGDVPPAKWLDAARARWPLSVGGTRLLIRVEGEQVTFSADCAGELLFRRGYRQEVSRAPLRETLAAGVLALGGYHGEVPLFDPMCGSGTLIIEGAWIARRRAPGSARRFAFEDWGGFDPARWAAEKGRAEAQERTAPAALQGADLNAGSLGVARRNARRAGVPELQWVRQDALAAPPPPEPGVLVCNLPYGKRVGGEGDPALLHRRFGEVLRQRFRGWTALLLTSEELADALGLEAEASWSLDNGGLRCRLLKSVLR